MSDYISSCHQAIMNAINRMDMQQWAALAALVVVIGLICMRGYGSRNKY